MSFYEAQQHFEAALRYTDPNGDPKTWNMLNGLVKLSQSLNHMESDVQALTGSLGKTSADVRRIKNR